VSRSSPSALASRPRGTSAWLHDLLGVVEDNGRLKDQLVAYSKALRADHARFKIEKYLRLAYAIASERRMRMPDGTLETAEAAFERLSSTKELELAGRIVMDNVLGPVSAS